MQGHDAKKINLPKLQPLLLPLPFSVVSQSLASTFVPQTAPKEVELWSASLFLRLTWLAQHTSTRIISSCCSHMLTHRFDQIHAPACLPGNKGSSLCKCFASFGTAMANSSRHNRAFWASFVLPTHCVFFCRAKRTLTNCVWHCVHNLSLCLDLCCCPDFGHHFAVRSPHRSCQGVQLTILRPLAGTNPLKN